MNTIYETLSKEQQNLTDELLGGEGFYHKRKTIWNVIKHLSKEEKRIYKKALQLKIQNTHMRTVVMSNKLLFENEGKISQQRMDCYKEISFQDSIPNVVWHALNYKAEYDTSLSFLDLYSAGYLSLNDAWKKFMSKNNEEIEDDILKGNTPYASFKTFSESYIRNSMVLEIMKQKNIDESRIDINKSEKYVISNISKSIQSYICMRGKMPSDEELSKITGYSVKVIQNSKYILNIGDYSNNEGVFECPQIKKDYDFGSVVSEVSNPLENKIKDESTKSFWKDVKENCGDRNFKILYKYFYQGKTMQEIGDEMNLSRERIRQLLNDTYSEIKNNPDLLELLYNSVK